MQHGSSISLDTEANSTSCAFCQHQRINPYTLKETSLFRIVTDHAPLTEGHLLIIPREHYACYGDVPAEFDEELSELKHEVQRFFRQFYAPAIFWEHGVFRQTVFHAHLHCFPFGELTYNLADELHDRIVISQEDIRTWYSSQGHYFYMEDAQHGLLFPPQMEPYQHIIRSVLWAGAAARNGHLTWRSAQQRQEEGKSLIATTTTRWRTFQQQGG